MNKKILLTLLGIIFLDMLGIGILIPVLPMLFTEPNSPYFVIAHSNLIQYAFIIFGTLQAAYPFAQFFAAPILGQLSDKYGRRRILIISQIGTCIGFVLFGFGVLAKSITLLFASRLLDGITGGNISVAQAALADISPPQARARTFGLMGVAFGIGFIIGPFLGGILSSPNIVSWFNPAVPFWFAAITSLLSVILTITILPETHPSPLKELRLDLKKSLHDIARAFSIKDLRILFATSWFFQSGFSFFISFLSVYLIQKFNFDQAHLGNFYGYIGIWIIITQGLITRKLSHHFNERTVLRFSMFIAAVSILLHFVPTVAWGLLLVTPIFAIGNGLTQSNLMGYMSRRAGKDVQGEILGINASMSALANVIPPLAAGVIAVSFTPATPIIVAAAMIFFAWALFLREPALPPSV